MKRCLSGGIHPLRVAVHGPPTIFCASSQTRCHRSALTDMAYPPLRVTGRITVDVEYPRSATRTARSAFSAPRFGASSGRPVATQFANCASICLSRSAFVCSALLQPVWINRAVPRAIIATGLVLIVALIAAITPFLVLIACG